MAEPGKYKKDGVVRTAHDKNEANQLVWQGFKPVGGGSAQKSASSSSSKPVAKKAAAKRASTTGTETNPDAEPENKSS